MEPLLNWLGFAAGLVLIAGCLIFAFGGEREAPPDDDDDPDWMGGAIA